MSNKGVTPYPDIQVQEYGASRKGCIPSLLEYLDAKDIKGPEVEEDIANIGAITFFGQPQHSSSCSNMLTNLYLKPGLRRLETLPFSGLIVITYR